MKQVIQELDHAVATAYGWHDLHLGHGFHATKQGERYSISEPARRTVLTIAPQGKLIMPPHPYLLG